MRVDVLPIGPLDVNCYVASSDGKALEGASPRLAVVVDPGGDPAPVLKLLETQGLTLEAVLLTHLHFDHVYGCAKLAAATGAPILAPAGDAPLLASELGGGGFMGFPKVERFDFTPLDSERGETRTLAGTTCEVLPTPGHTPGGVTFHFPAEKIAFTGDLIFHRGVGRTDFPGGDQNVLTDSIKRRIFTLPPETILYPGHGDPTSVQEEKLHNPFVGEEW